MAKRATPGYVRFGVTACVEAVLVLGWASTAAAAEEGVAKTTNTGSGYHPGIAALFLAAAFLALASGLLFSYLYHRKLLEAIPGIMRAAAGTTSVTSTDSEAIASTFAEGDFDIDRPPVVTKGKKAMFNARNSADRTVTWTAAGAGVAPEAETGAGVTFGVTFAEAGPATVTAKVDGATASVGFEVQEAASASVGGIVLPFAVRNWGRLVVTILGVGVIAALMALNVVSGEGGIGILGALLGVGAAAATADPAAEPSPASPAAGVGRARS